ncbi:MAG: DUF4870 domain-containing protein [Chloroflexi bacterium]|nr:DUF4870 domain-containing protein [Chloroflexota bacterium]
MPDFARMIDELFYSVIVLIAGVHWSLQEAVLMAGYTIKLVNQWLIENAFMPIIAQTNDSLSFAVSVVFVVALLVLGITYLLAAFIRLDIVAPRSAIMWYVAGILFFTIGPSFYQGMNTFRLNISQVMYLSVLQGLNDNAGDFSSLAQVDSNDLDLGALCDQFDVYLPGATGPGPIDGLDIAMAYLRGHAQDVMGYPQPVYSPGCGIYLQNPNPSTWAGEGGTSVVPMDWNMEGNYFDHNVSPITWDDVEDPVRDQAVSMAGSSQQRALTAWPLLLFGLVEQIVHLLITIAMGITFVSFGVAILFAFFKRTESIAHSIINQWIELIVQTTIIALIQALVIGFFLAGAATGSAAAIIGIGLICLVFIVITMWSGIKAVWNSFNRLFNAMGQVSGSVLLSPGSVTSAAVTGATAAATGGASLMTSMGSNALAGMNALNNGATTAQTAGLMFGGFNSLSGAARTLTHLPGLRGTALGEAAEQFTEGAATRQVARNIPVIGRAAAPLVGAALLSDRDPAKAEYDEYGRVVSRPMLVPAVGEALEGWTLPKDARRKRGARPQNDADWFEDENGEMVAGFTPARARRTGMFTPVASVPMNEGGEDKSDARRRQERSDYAAEMNSEEMEQHVSDALRSSTGTHSTLGAMIEKDGKTDMTRFDQVAARLEQSAEALANVARLQMQVMLGQLKVSGGGDVAGVMGDVIRGMQTERVQNGQPAAGGTDHLTVADRMARAMGVMPVGGEKPPIQADVSRFGLFADQALRLGVSGTQAEQVVREVKSSPDGHLTDQTRTALVEQVRSEGNLSYDTAREEVNRLEHSAQMLPNEITAFGMMAVPQTVVQPPLEVHPQIDVEPDITVEPQVDVTVEAPADDGDAAYTEAMRKQSALGGSGSVIGGSS